VVLGAILRNSSRPYTTELEQAESARLKHKRGPAKREEIL
jgi:hypothetical protein